MKNVTTLTREEFAELNEESQWRSYLDVIEEGNKLEDEVDGLETSLHRLETQLDEAEEILSRSPKVDGLLEEIHNQHGPYLCDVRLCQHTACVDARTLVGA